MKDIYYHLINSAIAGGLVMCGTLVPLLTGDADIKAIFLGLGLGLVTGLIVFLNKFNEWFKTQDSCPQKIFNFT